MFSKPGNPRPTKSFINVFIFVYLCVCVCVYACMRVPSEGIAITRSGFSGGELPHVCARI